MILEPGYVLCANIQKLTNKWKFCFLPNIFRSREGHLTWKKEIKNASTGVVKKKFSFQIDMHYSEINLESFED